ncbi:MAG: glycosyltransferase family 4 protein [Microthrixaceae bacterium]
MQEKLKVMMVTDSLQVGGAEQVAVDIANSLDRDTHQVYFCATRTDGLLRSSLREDVQVMVLERSATWDLVKLLKFGQYVRQQGIEVLHSHGRGTMKFVSLCKALGIVSAQHVFHDHFGRLHLDRSAGSGLKVPLQRGVDAYIGVESRLCHWAIKTVGLPPSKVNLVRSGVDLERFASAPAIDLRQEFDLGEGNLVLLMVANFRPQKDHPTLFRAIAELSKTEQESLRLVVCGSTTADPAYFQGCRDMLQRLKIDHLVTTIGVRNDAPSLMAGADAGVFSSKNESGPLVILEYMASKLPFVATETGEIAHAVKDSGVGILTEPRDYLELADALTELLRMTPEQRKEMGDLGRQLVVEQFEQHVVVRQIEAIYLQLLKPIRITV